jgi:hypothetical protein
MSANIGLSWETHFYKKKTFQAVSTNVAIDLYIFKKFGTRRISKLQQVINKE